MIYLLAIIMIYRFQNIVVVAVTAVKCQKEESFKNRFILQDLWQLPAHESLHQSYCACKVSLQHNNNVLATIRKRQPNLQHFSFNDYG